MIKAGGDGVYGADIPDRRRLPGGRGLVCHHRLAASDRRHQGGGVRQGATPAEFGVAPDDYSITAYDAALVIIDAVKRVAASGKPVTRDAVRDAIQTAKVPTIQGTVSFDANGDLADRTVSVFQIKKDPAAKPDDVSAQYHYIGVAPQA